MALVSNISQVRLDNTEILTVACREYSKALITIMKQPFILFLLGLLSTACNQHDKSKFLPRPNDSQPQTQEGQHPKRLSFESISEFVADSTSSIWVEKTYSSFSLALHFEEKETVWASYSPECLLVFPFKQDSNKLIVYWDNNIDTKYEFDLVKAVNKIDKALIGRPFMILELENDTTLKATYLLPDLKRRLNSSSKERTFFPDRFTLVQEGEMYD